MKTKDMKFVKKLEGGKWKATKKGIGGVQAIDIAMDQMGNQDKSTIDKEYDFGVFYFQGIVASQLTTGTLLATVLRKSKEPPTGSIS